MYISVYLKIVPNFFPGLSRMVFINNQRMPSRYRAIIVDDDPEALDILENLLVDHQEIKVVAKESNADEALKAIIRHNPDLIFLDIEMPGKDGFELVREMRDYHLNPVIIFVTAFNQYAINAFKVAAFDYLMKPVDRDELARCMARLAGEEKKKAFPERIDLLLDQTDPKKKIRIHCRSGYFYYFPNEILYLEADSSYTNIFLTNGRKQVITINLGTLSQDLPAQFAGISRSVVINLTYLKHVDHKNLTAGLICDDIHLTLKISRSYLQKIIHPGRD